MHRFFLLAALSLMLAPGVVFASDVPSPTGIDAPPPAGAGPSSAPERAGNGKSNTTGADAQTCTDSCNRSYEVCTDQGAALPGDQDALRNSNNLASQLIGTESDCSDHLRSCLNTCGG